MPSVKKRENFVPSSSLHHATWDIKKSIIFKIKSSCLVVASGNLENQAISIIFKIKIVFLPGWEGLRGTCRNSSDRHFSGRPVLVV